MALGKINITQDPNILTISNGDAARISCQWNKENIQRVRFQWRKHISSTGEDNGTLLCRVLVTEQNRTQEVRDNTRTCNVTNNTALLTIDAVTQEDDGLYICEVIIEIPSLIKARGNGTQLCVQEGKSGPSKQIFTVGVIIIFPFLVLAAYFMYKRKKRKSKTFSQKRTQEHLELNQMDQDAAKAEEESNSTNSVEWAVSTLYESFDYFAIKNPDDKAATPSTGNLVKPQTMEEPSLTAM
ncbi:cytotoxic T-lymphocyte protein 4-like [Eleutherodactylus coqui]|uniref:cytotoxic T-lymphocyte protein 4-like n=1 Tax=Eleutherodactylus coqui TaxID=57060 RepID=UPI003461D0DD